MCTGKHFSFPFPFSLRFLGDVSELSCLFSMKIPTRAGAGTCTAGTVLELGTIFKMPFRVAFLE